MTDNKKDDDFQINYLKHMEKRLRNLETEKQLLDAERLRLEQELHSLRNEIDRLREPPLIGAVVVRGMPEKKDKYLVLAPSGQIFVVYASKKVVQNKIEPGTYVGLNQRTFAIMEVLPLDKDQILEAAKKLIVDLIPLDNKNRIRDNE